MVKLGKMMWNAKVKPAWMRSSRTGSRFIAGLADRPFPDGPQYSGMRHDRTAGLRPRGSATVDKWQNPERGAKLTGYSAVIVPPVRRHISGNRDERHHRRNHRRGRARFRSRSPLRADPERHRAAHR